MASKKGQIRGVVSVGKRQRRDGTDYEHWYCSYKTEAGWRRNIRTDVPITRPEGEARDAALRLQAEDIDPRVRAEKTVSLVDAVALKHNYDEERVARGELSQATLDSYLHIAGRLTGYFGEDFLLHDLTLVAVRKFERERLKTVSRHTVTKERTYLRAVIRFGAREGWCFLDDSKLFDDEWIVGYKPRTRWLPFVEAESLLDQLDDNRAAHVAYFLCTAADWTPSTTARPEHFDWERGKRGIIWVPDTKTEFRAREVPVVSWTERYAKMAYEHLKQHGSFDPWGNKNRDLKVACRGAGIAPCSFKDLRRTAGMWAHIKTGNAGLTALFLGHSGTAMVMKTYARLQGEQLGEAMEGKIDG